MSTTETLRTQRFLIIFSVLSVPLWLKLQGEGMMPEKKTIWVITAEPVPPETGPTMRDWQKKTPLPAGVQIDVDKLQASMQAFLDNVREIVGVGVSDVGPFRLTEISLSATISADGELKLLGAGVGMGLSGGLNFVLRRKEA
jgi:hypothetical protein